MRVQWIASGLAALSLACEFGSTTGGGPGGGSDTTSAAEDAGTTRASAATGGSAADADDRADDRADDAGDTSTGGCGDGEPCAPMLRPLRYENPCLGTMTAACNFPRFCEMADVASDSATLQGETGVVYDVTLRFRGVVSQVFIVGGETDGYFNVGGDPMPVNPFHPVRLDVTDPPERYYLNAGPDQAEYCVAIDYERTVPIAAGAEVTLGHYDTSSCSPLNIDMGGVPVSLPGIDDPAQPYDGQFFRVDFVAATPRR